MIVYAPRALRDLIGIEDYLKQRSPAGSRNVLAAIKAAIDDLERFPRIGIPIDAEGRRRLPLWQYPYLVFYRVSGPDIFILHIRHGSRRPVMAEDL